MDAQRYDRMLPKTATGRKQTEEDRMASRFPIPTEYADTVITSPTLISDAYGKVLAWYVPGALSEERQVCTSRPKSIEIIMLIRHSLEGFMASRHKDGQCSGQLVNR